jgi:hypothetical protein
LVSAFRSPANTGRVAAYGAFTLALGYALVSLYWAAGGTRGLGTLGEPLERLARSGDASAAIVISIVIVLKLMGAFLALALVRPWGRRIPRRLLLVAGVVAAAVLVLYGAVEVLGESLVETGAIRPSGHVDWRALRWHLGVWDLWFLAWGVTLAVAVRGVPVEHPATHRRLAAEERHGQGSGDDS